MSSEPLLFLESVSKEFASSGLLGLAGFRPVAVKAVDNVTLQVGHREVLALVGESGCGKSTLARIAAGLIQPSSGRVLFRGRDITSLAHGAKRKLKLRVQMVFQSATASLNPRQTIRQILHEPLKVHRLMAAPERDAFVESLLRKIGLAESVLPRYPHQLSGGQCQRVGIARALTLDPELIICDEPVSALDVSVQAQILNLFQDLQESLGLTYLFISHDLSVVERISDRVAVMYLGRIVEEAPTEELFDKPAHPYTIALLSAIPRLDSPGALSPMVRLKGERPSPISPPTGCHFHPRCPRAFDLCRQIAPERKRVSQSHWAACHLVDSKPEPGKPARMRLDEDGGPAVPLLRNEGRW